MRNYRRNRQGSGKFKKILFRILFVIIAALVITVATVLIGHHLLNKVEDAGGLEYETDPTGNQISRDPTDIPLTNYHSETVFGCGINVLDFISHTDLINKISELSHYYDTLNIQITDDDGKFIYTSPALCEFLRIPSPDDDLAFTMIKAAAQQAKACGMRVTVIMAPSDFESSSSSVVDAAVAKEIAALGVNEILFIPHLSTSDYIDYNLANKIRAYFSEITDKIDGEAALGIILPASSYLTVSNTKQLQMIASAVSFMAIDLTSRDGSTPDGNYTYITDTITSLLGTFSTYNMRVMLRDTDQSLLSAAYRASINSNINNISFTTSVIPTSLSYSPSDNADEDSSIQEADTTSEAERTNPYAAVTRDEEDTADSGKPWF